MIKSTTRRDFLKKAIILSTAVLLWRCSSCISEEIPQDNQKALNISKITTAKLLYEKIDNAPVEYYEFDPIRSGFYIVGTIKIKKRVWIVENGYVVLKIQKDS